MASADPGRVPQGDGERIGATTGAVQKNRRCTCKGSAAQGGTMLEDGAGVLQDRVDGPRVAHCRGPGRRNCTPGCGQVRFAMVAILVDRTFCPERRIRRRCGRRARESHRKTGASLFDKVGIGAEMVGDHCAKARFTSVSSHIQGGLERSSCNTARSLV